MRVKLGHGVVIGGFDFGRRFGGDTKCNGSFAHASGGMKRHVATFSGRHLRQGKQPELLQNKVEIIFVKIPAIMHGRPQHPLAAEHFHNQRSNKMARGFRIGRQTRHILFFKPIDNIRAVLHNLALRRCHNRNNPAPDCGPNFGVIFRAGRRDVVKVNMLLDEIGARLGGIERDAPCVEFEPVIH